MRRLALAALLALAQSRLEAQDTVSVRDVGPGPSGRMLRVSLAQPHTLLRATPGTPAALARGAVYPRTVIVLGGDATVAATVHGDVIVVGGDLYLHPGGAVDGRAVAIGGAVYNSTLAQVRGGRFSYRDHTFDVVRTPGGTVLDYRVIAPRALQPVVLPGLYGVRPPAYDRVNGVSLTFGPLLSLDTARIEIEPTLTYRSDLGAVDPALLARLSIGRRLDLQLHGGRGTLTRDAWIRPDILNSIAVLALGSDARNYYRADFGEARLRHRWEGGTVVAEPMLGARTERAWSVGPALGDSSAPWSVVGRRDSLGMLRPNPAVLAGRISSALAGLRLEWADQGVRATITAETEVSVEQLDGQFVQTTVDGDVGFPTFGDQRFELRVHAVTTASGPAPPQRFAYLGGTGTLPTFDLLQFGGDQLLFLDGEYLIPLKRLALPILGVPTLSLRHSLGAAGVGELPALEQNLALQVTLSLVRVGIAVDPASRRSRLILGLAFFR